MDINHLENEIKKNGYKSTITKYYEMVINLKSIIDNKNFKIRSIAMELLKKDEAIIERNKLIKIYEDENHDFLKIKDYDKLVNRLKKEIGFLNFKILNLENEVIFYKNRKDIY